MDYRQKREILNLKSFSTIPFKCNCAAFLNQMEVGMPPQGGGEPMKRSRIPPPPPPTSLSAESWSYRYEEAVEAPSQKVQAVAVLLELVCNT